MAKKQAQAATAKKLLGLYHAAYVLEPDALSTVSVKEFSEAKSIADMFAENELVPNVFKLLIKYEHAAHKQHNVDTVFEETNLHLLKLIVPKCTTPPPEITPILKTQEAHPVVEPAAPVYTPARKTLREHLLSLPLHKFMYV